MKRHRVLVALLSVLLSSVPVAITAGSHIAQGPVYATAQAQAGLVDHPQAWVGRTIWVRGLAMPCPWWGGTTRLWECADDALILVADPIDPVAEPFPLNQEAPAGILAVLHGLPFLHGLAPLSRAVPVFTPARFRVRLRSLATQPCGGRFPRYEAVLLAVSTQGVSVVFTHER
jgi:hypothetical protein